jgi:uncharacterized damage-inducible protein DinB
MKISDALLPEFDHEMAGTRKALARCPDDKFAFTPHPKSWPMVSLATHIVNMTGWTVDTIATDSFDVAPPGAPPHKEEPATSNADLLARFDKNVAAARAAIAGASDEHLMAQWSLLQGGQTVFAMPRIACIRTMIMNHIIHHRGQLCIYLRLNDIPVPALYGPSADEMS